MNLYVSTVRKSIWQCCNLQCSSCAALCACMHDVAFACMGMTGALHTLQCERRKKLPSCRQHDCLEPCHPQLGSPKLQSVIPFMITVLQCHIGTYKDFAWTLGRNKVEQ